MSTLTLALIVGTWLVALGRGRQPRDTRTPWSRLGLRESAALALAGAAWLGRTREAHFEE